MNKPVISADVEIFAEVEMVVVWRVVEFAATSSKIERNNQKLFLSNPA